MRFGRRPDPKTIRRVLAEGPAPLRMMRRFPPYHEIAEPRERRLAVVRRHSEGWAVKAIAGYLRINRDTVYGVLGRWFEHGEEGLEDRKRGWPRLFGTPFASPQPRLFGLDDAGWLKALRPREYAPRGPRRPAALQEVLFPYLEAL